MGCHFLLQGIFLSQGSSLSLLLRGPFTLEPLPREAETTWEGRISSEQVARGGQRGVLTRG